MNNHFPPSSDMLVLQNYEFYSHFFLSHLLKKKKKKKKKKNPPRNDPASVSKSFPLHFQIRLFWVSISLYGFLIIVFFFFFSLTSCFWSSFVQTHFALSYSGVNFSPFCRPVLFQQLLIHCTLEGHACSKCFDNLQLFALKDVSRKIELHKLPAEWH